MPCAPYSVSIEVTSASIRTFGASSRVDVVEITTLVPTWIRAVLRMLRSGSRNTSVNVSGIESRSMTVVLSRWMSTLSGSLLPSISISRWMATLGSGMAAQALFVASATLGIRRTDPGDRRIGSSMALSSAIARQYCGLPSSR